jgi:hypothetical protein
LFKGQFKINGGNKFCGMKGKKRSNRREIALKMKVQEELAPKEM